MFEFNNVSGESIPKWANNFLNDRIDPSDHDEYNTLIHGIELRFMDWNKLRCSDCKSVSWPHKESFGFLYNHGCCAMCMKNRGYFDRDDIREIFVKKSRGFKKVHGFFDESIYGCSLPRHVRSATCLRYCCDYKMTKEIIPIIDRIVEIRKYY